MSDATPGRPGADRNLLFGILALQMDFIGRDALIAAMHAWVLDKSRPLGQILVGQLSLRADERDAIEALVGKHLERHGGDIEKSLAAVQLPTPLRHDLHSLGDGDVQASLAQLTTPTAAGAALSLPATIGDATSAAGRRYQVLRPHARGGLGEVFVALDHELRREVALKEILPECADDPLSRGRFIREAEITGGLEHPGIVPVHGLGTHSDGRPFYAMRFIQGETLQEAIAKYHAGDVAWTLRALLTRFVAVCNTVAYAHSRGVLHRDLKPANVMLGRYGETLLVDWGLAKPLGEPSDQGAGDATVAPALLPGLVEGIETQAGSALGTPAYMSPEQALGRLDQVGPASDVYSLGATLYTILTGRPPGEGKDRAELLRKAQSGDWLPPRRVKADVPAALDAVCRKALALRPEERYGTALELAADLERWLADEPVTAWREPWGVRVRRWMRRHRTLVSTAVGVLIFALLGTTAGLVLIGGARDREEAARKTAEDKEEEARQQKEEADRRREEARLNQYVAQINLVQREYEAGNIDHTRQLLEELVPTRADEADLRQFEWHYWHLRTQQELRTLQGHADSVSSVAFSPDGARLVSSYPRGRAIKFWDVHTGQELLAWKLPPSSVRYVAFSPDGKRLASTSLDNTITLWDAQTGKELHVCKGHKQPIETNLAFSPDGKRLASGGNDRTIKLWDAETGEELRTIAGHTAGVSGLAFSPDGKRLASASYDSTIKLWDPDTFRQISNSKGHTGWVTSVAFSPDSKRLASGATDHNVTLWDADAGRELLTFQGHTQSVSCVAFGPDGTRLASASDDGTVRVWDTATGRELRALRGHRAAVKSVAFNPDGTRLASAGVDGTIKLWSAGVGWELLTIDGEYGSVAFSPDGTRLASGRSEGSPVAGYRFTIRVHDALTGQELLSLRGHENTITSLVFSEDGKRLASASTDHRIKLWDTATGRELFSARPALIPLESVALSRDGTRLAAASQNSVKLWDADTGGELRTFPGHTKWVTSVAISPDGKRLASASMDNTAKLWDAETGQELHTLQAHTDRVSSVAFSPDGRQLASGSDDWTIRLWDVGTGEEVRSLRGHTKGVQCLAFSANGQRLASAGWDGTVRLWDPGTGRELLSIQGHTWNAYGLAFSPDGTRLALPGWGNGIPLKVWETSAVPPEVVRQRELVVRVRSLFDELLLRAEVLDRLRKNSTLDEADRAFALQVAQTHGEDASALMLAAWMVVKNRDAGKDAYAAALRRAEAAVRLIPGEGAFLRTLGVAHYRVGDHAQALETLEKSEKVRAATLPLPADLAFLAMAHHQLGHKPQAQATLARLREMMKPPAWKNDAEAQGFLREAEELIEGKAADKKD
jgi:WD40 repeat protein/tRNA A-37 threonylcarbamoyl transferase component Bud32